MDIHIFCVVSCDPADEMAVTKYISKILNGSRKHKGIKKRMEDAF